MPWPARPTWRRQYKAAELSLPGSALSGLAACKIHGFDGFNVERPELIVAYTRNHRTCLASVHRSDSALTTSVGRLRVTTVAQTLCDIVSRVRLDRWERAADGLLLERRLTVDDLQERRVRYDHSRRPGISTFRVLVDDRLADGYTPKESELERGLASVLELVAGCPTLQWQVPAPWAPGASGSTPSFRRGGSCSRLTDGDGTRVSLTSTTTAGVTTKQPRSGSA